MMLVVGDEISQILADAEFLAVPIGMILFKRRIAERGRKPGNLGPVQDELPDGFLPGHSSGV